MPPKQRYVAGVGTVDFPEGMDDTQIAAAIKQYAPANNLEAQPGALANIAGGAQRFAEQHDTLLPYAGAGLGFLLGGPAGAGIGAAAGTGAVHAARAMDPSYPSEGLMGPVTDTAVSGITGAALGGLLKAVPGGAVARGAAELLPGRLGSVARILGLGKAASEAGGGAPEASAARPEAPAGATGTAFPMPKPPAPPKMSTEVPYQATDADIAANEQATSGVRQKPGISYDPQSSMASERMAQVKSQPPSKTSLGKTEMPNLSQTPSMRYGARVEFPGGPIDVPAPKATVEAASPAEPHPDDLNMLRGLLESGYSPEAAQKISGVPNQAAQELIDSINAARKVKP